MNAARHCAYCLATIPDGEIKVCGRCKRRAYCNRNCQALDWLPKNKGQGHKNWCHLECGEEDLDWEVSPVPGKGLGLIAKRLLPENYRIIVDACRAKDHPSIQDLMPNNGTYEEKFRLNCLGCGIGDDETNVLCLRIARANHQCNANAEHAYDNTFKVKILFALKDIQQGEEICINYLPFGDISKDISSTSARLVLQSKWGITCPSDCFCYNKEMENIIRESKALDTRIMQLASQGNHRSVDAALKAVKKLLENHAIIRSSWLNKQRTLYDGFQIAVMRKKTLDQAKEFLQTLYSTESRILSPESEETKRYLGYLTNLASHHNYLIMG